MTPIQMDEECANCEGLPLLTDAVFKWCDCCAYRKKLSREQIREVYQGVRLREAYEKNRQRGIKR